MEYRCHAHRAAPSRYSDMPDKPHKRMCRAANHLTGRLAHRGNVKKKKKMLILYCNVS